MPIDLEALNKELTKNHYSIEKVDNGYEIKGLIARVDEKGNISIPKRSITIQEIINKYL